MTAQGLFGVAGRLALAGWVLLAAFPRRRWVTFLAGVAVPLLLSLLYAALILTHYRSRPAGSGFSSLAQVSALFSDPWLLLAGWVHYLAFDLFTGVWETRDAQRAGVPRWALLPCLLLTFVFGPIGLLVYFVVRRSLRVD